MLRHRGRLALSMRRALFVLPLWIASMGWMWSWWLTSDHARFLPLFIPLSLALLYEFALLPSIFLYFVMKAKKPPRRIAQKGLKVAVISLCVPSSESLDIVEKQLQAMANITYPHDSWILDEGNDKAIKALARKYGVKHFSRQGIDKYNQPAPPFQQKTKAGNVNAWLDRVKRRKYDYFVQLDIDHIPKPEYLNKTLGYFRDPLVAWVQAPSVYKNLDSWTARGAAEQELVLQGPLQMGFYGHSETPFIIGSHCTYRMSAIREIGGFQPTRAEDHLDTVYLASSGYKGVFLPEIIAEGDGPETLSTYLAQQFAWAYSMFQVLLMHTPRLVRTMSGKRKWQFLFAQTWYPLWTLSYFIMFFSPIAALVIGRDVVQVDPVEMLTHFVPTYISGFIVWWAARPIMQPHGLGLTWRGVLLHVVRWPIILRAILEALFKVKKPYMITPKGSYARMVPLVATYRPFLVLGMMSALAAMLSALFHDGPLLEGQIVFAITNAIFMLTICTVDIGLRFNQARPKLQEIRQLWLRPVMATSLLAIMLGGAVTTSVLSTTRMPVLATDTVAVRQITATPAHNDMSTQELKEQIGLVPRHQSELPTLGMYNQSLDVPNGTQPYIQHSFVDWRDDHYFALVLAKTLQAGNIPLVTIEARGQDDGALLLSGIIAGEYDTELGKLASIIKQSKNPIYIRFGHEMELANLYPWGNQSPDLYITAYRYTADYLRIQGSLEQLRFVWSPAGNRGAEAYYPGDRYVDAVGTTVLADAYWYGSTLPNFSTLASGRQWLQTFDKPVWIVEFGAGRANKVQQQRLIAEALGEYEQRGYTALVYLNLIDANIVGPDYSLDTIYEFGPLFPNPVERN